MALRIALNRRKVRKFDLIIPYLSDEAFMIKVDERKYINQDYSNIREEDYLEERIGIFEPNPKNLEKIMAMEYLMESLPQEHFDENPKNKIFIWNHHFSNATDLIQHCLGWAFRNFNNRYYILYKVDFKLLWIMDVYPSLIWDDSIKGRLKPIETSHLDKFGGGRYIFNEKLLISFNDKLSHNVFEEEAWRALGQTFTEFFTKVQRFEQLLRYMAFNSYHGEEFNWYGSYHFQDTTFKDMVILQNKLIAESELKFQAFREKNLLHSVSNHINECNKVMFFNNYKDGLTPKRKQKFFDDHELGMHALCHDIKKHKIGSAHRAMKDIMIDLEQNEFLYAVEDGKAGLEAHVAKRTELGADEFEASVRSGAYGKSELKGDGEEQFEQLWNNITPNNYASTKFNLTLHIDLMKHEGKFQDTLNEADKQVYLDRVENHKNGKGLLNE